MLLDDHLGLVGAGDPLRQARLALTPDEIAREVWAQLKAHLNDTGRKALTDDMMVSSFVDPAIRYPPELAGQPRTTGNDEPLLINTPGSWDDGPRPRRRSVNVFKRWSPPELEPLRRIDAQRYRAGQKHVLDSPWVLGDVLDRLR